ncbi:MAG: phosphatase PAP2 family protein, partial [bacterium]|nr:phosphatase PAP2 family protein [bacterium]
LSFFNYPMLIRENIFLGGTFKSFPSGHTINAFSAVTPFFLSLKGKKWRYGLYAVPILTGLARIYYNKHWLSDVILGAFLALYTGSVIWRSNKEPGKN